MVFEGAYPKTPEELDQYTAFLQDGTLPPDVTLRNQWTFERKMKLWKLRDGVLYRRATEDKPARRFVPEWDSEFRASLFRQFHDDDRHINYKAAFKKISSLHIGVTKAQVRAYVNECNTCKRVSSIKEKDDIVPVVSSGPMEHLQMDLIDLQQYKDANDGFSWMLTIVCIFSKFLWAFALRNKEAATVGSVLVELFSQWGAPDILQSDNGKEFVADVIQRICASLGIQIRHGRPRHPMSQGQVERLNQTVGRGFTKMMWKDDEQLQHVDWTKYLSKFVFSYNTTIHSSHEKTPREVLFGHKLLGIYRTLQPGQPDESAPEIDGENEVDGENVQPSALTMTAQKRVEEHLKKVTRIHDEAKEQLEKTRNYMVKHGSVHRRKTPFEPGQTIAVAPDTDMNPNTRKRKLQPHFSNTATVVRVTNNNHTLVVMNDKSKEMRVPVKRARILQSKN